MKKALKFGTLVTLLMLLISVSSVAFAEENDIIEKFDHDENFVNENVGVTTDSPMINGGETGYSPLGLSKPTTVHNLNTAGQMNFSGSAQISDLYTNKNFTGKSSINIYIKNYHTSDLTVKLYKQGSLLATKTWKLESGYSVSSNPTGLDPKANYYLKFYAPSNFDGYVK